MCCRSSLKLSSHGIPTIGNCLRQSEAPERITQVISIIVIITMMYTIILSKLLIRLVVSVSRCRLLVNVLLIDRFDFVVFRSL